MPGAHHESDIQESSPCRGRRELNLRLRAQGGLKEKAGTYVPIFVRAGDVLDTSKMWHYPFVDIQDPARCYREGLAMELRECLENARPCDSCTPRGRLGNVSSSLANNRQRAEDLVTLGREAMARAYVQGRLKAELDRCLARAPSAALPLVTAP